MCARVAVLMDKGIIVGVDQETSLRRSLDFALFRIITTVRPLVTPLSRSLEAATDPVRDVDARTDAPLLAPRPAGPPRPLAVARGRPLRLALPAARLLPARTRDAPARGPRGRGRLGRRVVVDIAKRARTCSRTRRAPRSGHRLPRPLRRLPAGRRQLCAQDRGDEVGAPVPHCRQAARAVRGAFPLVLSPRRLLLHVCPTDSPRILRLQKCIASGFFKVAASYLLVLHNLEPVEQSSKVSARSLLHFSLSLAVLTLLSMAQDTVRLLKVAMEAGEWTVR